MQLSYAKKTVDENIQISNGIFKLTIKGGLEGKPGQFYMLRAGDKEPFLPRPISIHDITKDEISFLYEVRGEGTELFSKLKPGDHIQLMGPLGNGFDIEEIKGKVAIVTGGIGIAPMLYTIKSLRNDDIHLYAGFRNDPYLLDSFQERCNSVNIATDSGNMGQKGYITDIFDPSFYDVVLCCGPEIMMNKVINACKEKGVTSYVSMESHMACGIGACLGCTCKTTDGFKRTCKEGPVFLGKDVVMDA